MDVPLHVWPVKNFLKVLVKVPRAPKFVELLALEFVGKDADDGLVVGVSSVSVFPNVAALQVNPSHSQIIKSSGLLPRIWEVRGQVQLLLRELEQVVGAPFQNGLSSARVPLWEGRGAVRVGENFIGIQAEDQFWLLHGNTVQHVRKDGRSLLHGGMVRDVCANNTHLLVAS